MLAATIMNKYAWDMLCILYRVKHVTGSKTLRDIKASTAELLAKIEAESVDKGEL